MNYEFMELINAHIQDGLNEKSKEQLANERAGITKMQSLLLGAFSALSILAALAVETPH